MGEDAIFKNRMIREGLTQKVMLSEVLKRPWDKGDGIPGKGVASARFQDLPGEGGRGWLLVAHEIREAWEGRLCGLCRWG